LKLHSPSFEKALRRGVKKAVRSSPELKKEYRRAKKAIRRNVQANWLFRPIWSLVLGFFVYGITSITLHPVTGLAIINLWTLITLSSFARNLLVLLFRAPDLPALNLLPISESSIFRWELQKFFRKMALLSVFNQVAGFGALAIYLHFSYGQWVMAMTLAVLSWVMLLGLALLCAARLPRVKYQLITSSVFMLGFALLMAFKAIGPAVLRFIDSIAPSLNLISPTGWVPSLFQLLLPDRDWMVVVLIVPVIPVIWSIKNSIGVLRSRSKFEEHITPEVPDQIPGKETDAVDLKDRVTQPSRVGVTAIEEIVQSRQFLVREQPQGWLEKRLWEWFNLRERTVAEFAFPRGIHITKPWKSILRNFSLMVLIGLVFSKVNQMVEIWVVGIGLFITVCQCLAQIWANGTAFRVMFSSGVKIPMYAAYPISFLELSRTLFKPSIIQLPLFIAYTVACAILIAFLTNTPITDGIIIGFKAGSLIFAGRFITTALAFSACTNDSTRFRLRNIVLILVFIGGACAFMFLGGAGLFVPNTLVAWLLWLAALVDAYALFRIYGWFYHRNCFDLMSFQRR
jgi:hypothetical protein